MNFDDRPARNRVDLAGKTLRFSDHAIAALKELDETVAGYTQAAELFACGLTRRIGPVVFSGNQNLEAFNNNLTSRFDKQ